MGKRYIVEEVEDDKPSALNWVVLIGAIVLFFIFASNYGG